MTLNIIKLYEIGLYADCRTYTFVCTMNNNFLVNDKTLFHMEQMI